VIVLELCEANEFETIVKSNTFHEACAVKTKMGRNRQGRSQDFSKGGLKLWKQKP